MAIDLTSILQIVTAVSAGAVAIFSAPPLWAWRQKLGLDTLQMVAGMACQVVAAVEQKQAGAPGVSKKALALNILEGILSARGLQVPESYIDVAIEAAVLALQPPTTAPIKVVLPFIPPVASVTVTSSSSGSNGVAPAAEARAG